MRVWLVLVVVIHVVSSWQWPASLDQTNWWSVRTDGTVEPFSAESPMANSTPNFGHFPQFLLHRHVADNTRDDTDDKSDNLLFWYARSVKGFEQRLPLHAAALAFGGCQQHGIRSAYFVVSTLQCFCYSIRALLLGLHGVVVCSLRYVPRPATTIIVCTFFEQHCGGN